MIKDINGLGSLPETKTRPGSSGKQALQDTANDAPAAAETAKQDAVELSSQVQTLQSLEAKLQGVPEVNEARVEAIKQALEDGNFKIDDLVLADKLINSDALLGE